MGRLDQPYWWCGWSGDSLDPAGKRSSFLFLFLTSSLEFVICLISVHWQYHCVSSTRFPLFGQILAALYQNDIVDEDDIQNWHAKPEAKGEGVKSGNLLENIQKTWIVGARMIHQLNEQESDDDESSEGAEDSEESE